MKEKIEITCETENQVKIILDFLEKEFPDMNYSTTLLTHGNTVYVTIK